MVIIRLSRGGAKKSPFYQVVVTDSRSARDGRYIERLGYYSPLARGKAQALELNQERITYWISKGAQLSDRMAYILKNAEALKNGSLIAKKNEVKQKELKERQAKADAKRKAEADAAKAEAAAQEAPAEEGAQ